MGKVLDFIRPRNIRIVQEHVAKTYGLHLTRPQAAEILDSPTVKASIDRFGFDYVTQEKVGAFLSLRITGRAWPKNGESREAKKAFFDSFSKNAPLKGYPLIKT